MATPIAAAASGAATPTATAVRFPLVHVALAYESSQALFQGFSSSEGRLTARQRGRVAAEAEVRVAGCAEPPQAAVVAPAPVAVEVGVVARAVADAHHVLGVGWAHGRRELILGNVG